MNLKKNKIGILGGSFDPAHKGHLAISKEAAKRFKLKKIVWAITEKNPFKKKSNLNLLERIKSCKRIIGKNNTQSVTSSWSTLQSSRSFLQAVQSQVKASEVATEGISFEYESGSGRSTFDVLQSRSNLINAKINLAEAERSYLLAQYRVLKSVGLLNSDYLNLK